MKRIVVEKSEVTPSKIVCIGRNYVEHIHELANEIPDEMVVFCKPNSAISATLRAHHLGEQLHYEAEICFVVENGELAAVGCGLDLTKRDLQSRLKTKGLPWERAKGFDGAALFSPFVRMGESLSELGVELAINGMLRQKGTASLMLYSPHEIITELKRFYHFEDGDIIMTGTPAGVGTVVSGDLFEIRLLVGDVSLTGCSWQAL